MKRVELIIEAITHIPLEMWGVLVCSWLVLILWVKYNNKRYNKK